MGHWIASGLANGSEVIVSYVKLLRRIDAWFSKEIVMFEVTSQLRFEKSSREVSRVARLGRTLRMSNVEIYAAL